ncbi:MAG: methyltransferase [Ruminococcaceae bacterium]|nr:methyltransferase [Oscillospiraceae bacterium]
MMNMQKWLEDLKAARVKKAMPILSFPGVSLMDATVGELIKDSTLQAKAMELVAKRVDSLASVSLMDLSVEVEAFGAEVKFFDDEVPTVTGAIVTTPEEAEDLKVPEVGTKRTGIYVDAIKKAIRVITDRPVFAGVIGPFSLAGRLMDVSEIMVNCYVEPEMVHKTMEKTTEFLINYIKEYKNAGANGVVMAEPLTGMLSPDLAREFSEPYVKKISDSVKDEDFLIIYHNCGDNIIQMCDSIIATGCDAYHFGDSIKLADMLSHFSKDTVVMGNVSPSRQFKEGTPESMKKETIEIMTECKDYPNFVISSGCDIPPTCSWDNIDAFFEAVKEYYEG